MLIGQWFWGSLHLYKVIRHEKCQFSTASLRITPGNRDDLEGNIFPEGGAEMTRGYVYEHVVTPRDATTSGIAYDGSYINWICTARERMMIDPLGMTDVWPPSCFVGETYLRYMKPAFLNDRIDSCHHRRSWRWKRICDTWFPVHEQGQRWTGGQGIPEDLLSWPPNRKARSYSQRLHETQEIKRGVGTTSLKRLSICLWRVTHYLSFFKGFSTILIFICSDKFYRKSSTSEACFCWT